MIVEPGTRLGRYEVRSLLGAGGMGEVFLANDVRLDRHVAIKVLPARFASDPDRRARFEGEARAVSKLNHPHICTLYDVGQQDDVDFLVMEHLDGETLATLLSRGALTPEQVLTNARPVAYALAHAHERGIIHRDLKTSNVMITQEGLIKVLDFGLAETTSQEEVDTVARSQETLSGAGLAGTLPYMAPEVLQGQPADERSDVWAFGVLFYEMMTGQLPFRGQSGFALATAIMRDPFEPLPETIAAGFHTIVELCLAKDPRRRYQRASEVGAVLLGVQSSVTKRPRGEPSSSPERLPAESRGKRIRALAVLPLTNLTGDPDREYFVDGMTEALIANLAKIGTLRVISRTSVMQYKDVRRPLPEIGRELGVDAVIEGSVRRSNDRVSIRAQLIRADTEEHIWSESYERELQDVLALQSVVAKAIAQEIRIVLSPEERKHIEPAGPVNPQAHEHYLRGRYSESKRTEEGMNKAVESYKQAITLDPQFGLAYAGLASLLALGQFYGMIPAEETSAKSLALTAVELDNTRSEAYVALGLAKSLEWDWGGAEEAFQRAIAVGAASADAHHFYGLYCAMVGRCDEALAEMKRARQLDPLSLVSNTDLGWAFYFARRYDEAAEQIRSTLEFESGFFEAHWCLGRICLQLRMFPEAVTAFQEVGRLTGGIPFITACLGCALAFSGDKDEALKILDQLTSMPPGVAPATDIACLYIALGDKDKAFEWLETAFEFRETFLTVLKPDPRFDLLRSDPRFAVLLDRLGLE